MKIIQFIKSFFKPSKKALAKADRSKVIKSEDTDQYKNAASFTDYNNKTIFVSVKLVDNKPFFFIGDEQVEFVFDKDSAALLMLLINDYITSSSFKNFEAFVKGDINNEKRQ